VFFIQNTPQILPTVILSEDLREFGVGVPLLAALAGHSQISITQKCIDVNADQMRETVELL
jgi:hypothetical protein